MSPIAKNGISRFRFSFGTMKPFIISILIFNPSIIHDGIKSIGFFWARQLIFFASWRASFLVRKGLLLTFLHPWPTPSNTNRFHSPRNPPISIFLGLVFIVGILYRISLGKSTAFLTNQSFFWELIELLLKINPHNTINAQAWRKSISFNPNWYGTT